MYLMSTGENALLRKGPIKYYIIKIVGGWVWPNACVCLHGEWVGLARCLRNQKIAEKEIF